MTEKISKELARKFERNEIRNINDVICEWTINHKVKVLLDKFLNEKSVSSFSVLFSVFNILLDRYSIVDDMNLSVYFQKNKCFFDMELLESGSFINYVYQTQERMLSPRDQTNYPSLIFENIQDGTFFDCVEILDESERNIQFFYTEQSTSEIKIYIKFDKNDYDENTISRMLENYEELLLNCLKHPSMNINKLNVVSLTEQQLIKSFFKKSSYVEKPIIELFEEQVRNQPNKIAVSFMGESLTYQELNWKANQIANEICQSKKRESEFVAIFLNRSVNVIASILGILKVGMAYVPIDPELPIERIKYILDDCGSELVVVSEKEEDKLFQVYSRTVINLSNFCSQEKKMETSNFKSGKISLDSIAYLIYTSGSTGKPKGTILTQRGVINLATWEIFGINKSSRVLQFSSFSFDASIIGVFCTLLNGGTIIIASQDDMKDIKLLTNLLENEKITFTLLSPSLISQLPPTAGPYLEVLASGGEACTQQIAEQWSQRLDFINLYGPTEATVCVTGWSSKKNGQIPKVIPIGEPLPNAEIYILDKNRNMVPIGVKGELYIGGPMLAKGYLGLSEQTATSFIDSPLKKDSKLYKTGDIGRYLSNGQIEFAGRSDSQLKIRGFRIEIDEVEALFLENSSIREVVVLSKENASDENYLVAYIVPNNAIKKAELWKYINEKMPVYMRPTYIEILEDFPKTITGKIDRKSLPAPNSYVEKADDFNGHLTVIQSQLLKIWRNVLQLDFISIEDNFFEKGGHSISVMKLANQIEKNYGIDIRVKNLYSHPKIIEQEQMILKKMKVENSQKAWEKYAQDHETIKEWYELSSQQRGIWHSCLLDKTGYAYNIPLCYELKSNIDFTTLQKALEQIVSEQPTLKTIFKTIDKHPVQKIVDEVDCEIEKINFQTLNELKIYVESEMKHRFNLENGPLFYVKILCLSNEKKYLFINVHHIIFDGLSLNIFMQQLTKCYKEIEKADSIIPKKQPNLSYQTYSNQNIGRSNDATREKQRDYWMKEVLDSETVTALPGDYNMPLLNNFEGAEIGIDLSPKMLASLKLLSKKFGLSEFTIILSAFYLTLYSYNRQSKINIGITVAGRPTSNFEEIIGMFVNTLPICMNFDKCQTVFDVLSMVKDKVINAIEYQEFPFEKILEDSKIERTSNRHPLFSVVCSQENLEIMNEESIVGKTVFNNLVKTSKYDMSLSMNSRSTGTTINLEYRTQLFDKETIQHFLDEYIRILENLEPMIDENYTKVFERNAEILSFEYENELNPVHTRLTDTMKERFEHSVEKYADRVAIKYNNEKKTYRELNNSANTIANYILSQGIAPQSKVIVIAERSLAMIEILLGVLKAGCVYIPVDSSYPTKRMKHIIKDSESKLLITSDKDIVEGLNLSEDIDLLSLTDIYSSIHQNTNNPSVQITRDSALYVIYTSGSTGNPKGVVINNRNVIRLFEATKQIFQFHAFDIWCMFHSYCFDFSVWEMYGALLFGGCLVIVPKETAQNTRDFYDFLVNENISILNQTPSAFYQLLKEEAHRENHLLSKTLRHLIFGGEILDIKRLSDWFDYYHLKVNVVNMYGITETTVHATYKVLTVKDCLTFQRGSVIGKPLRDLEVLLLDENGFSVPKGADGEMYISGAGLANGYLNDKKKTEVVFKELQINGGIKRWYKTGDLARLNAENELVYLGRIDEQIKIRGYRIELKEIESVLLRLKNVNNGVVLVERNNELDKYIAMYVEAGAGVTKQEIREYLAQYLPSYMVPAKISFVKSIPLTVNGKVDKKSLLVNLVEETISSNRVNSSSITNTEKELMRIWENILGVSTIDVESSFFELGGHSLLILDLLDKIEKIFEKKIDYGDIFENQTIASLSKLIELKN